MKTPEEITGKLRNLLGGIQYYIEKMDTIPTALLKSVYNDISDSINDIEAYHAQCNAVGMQGLIERVEDKMTIENPVGVYYDGYNAAVKDAIEVIRATPCIDNNNFWFDQMNQRYPDLVREIMESEEYFKYTQP